MTRRRFLALVTHGSWLAAMGILVYQTGRITEMGTHADLIRAQGHYYNLYTRQFRRERETAYEAVSGQISAFS